MGIKVSKLHDNALIPTRKHDTDAGLDFYSLYDVIIPANSFWVLRTGITVEIPQGYCGQIWPKSGTDMLIGGGIIDSGYQGEILVKIYNGKNQPLVIRQGQAIAQLVLVLITTPEVEEVPLIKIHEAPTERKATGGIVKTWSQLNFVDSPQAWWTESELDDVQNHSRVDWYDRDNEGNI